MERKGVPQSHAFVSLRTRLLLLLAPLVLISILIVGTLSVLSARTAVTRLATRLLSYKAEQVRGFAYSQWELLEDLGLSEEGEYRQTAATAIQSFASSLIRSSTEFVVAIDDNEAIRVSTGGPYASAATAPELIAVQPKAAGLERFQRDGETYISQSFYFEPFGWRVFVGDRTDAFYSDVQRTTHTIIYMTVAIMVLAVLLTLWFAKAFIEPIEIVTAAMQRISKTSEYNERIPVFYPDEIGILSASFNTMITSIAQSDAEVRAAVEAEQHAKREALDREFESLRLLAAATEYKDKDTGEHIERVGRLSSELGRLLELSEREIDELARSSPLHDVGKLGIPEAILLKPARLTDEEYSVVKTHTTIGFEIMNKARSRYLRAGAVIAHTHHERWDGTGYPNGLTGEDIPIQGRIVAIVDTLDALLSNRPYKQAWLFEEAMEEIRRGSGSHFDPEIVAVLDRNHDRFRALLERSVAPRSVPHA